MAGAFAADVTRQAQVAVDPAATLTVSDVEGGALKLEPLHPRSFALGAGALWLRLDLPAHDAARATYVQLSGSTVVNRASFFTRAPDGSWHEQRAGDHVAVAQWAHPAATPLFDVPAAGGRAWLRIENQPAPVSPFLQLMDEGELQQAQRWTFVGIGMYLGFGLLVLIVGLIHGRLYGERVFYSYCAYVLAMLMFQLAYTGLGGLLLWPQSAAVNDAAPGFFMLAMTAAGIWNIREAVALRRHSRSVDRFTLGFIGFGALFALAYNAVLSPAAYVLLNLYGLAAVILSMALCLWTWRRGERYSGWLFLGFLPVHLAYPFPALRAAGVIADSWATQYAVLIGSAIEIPLLLYILHARAKDFSENRARLRALDSTDPLTGLTTLPVLMLRLRDALRRAQRLDHRFALLVVELANHGDILARGGRTAADRALVVAASRLSRLVREIDTVCRIEDARFAILTEGPQGGDLRAALAQHIIARGLEPVPHLDVALRFRVVTAWLPDTAPGASPKVGGADEQGVLQRLGAALDELLQDPRRVLQHLEAGAAP
ncbi:sensor domain-containing diguanylate cyclase [Ramlibacter sp. PS4R-6]|uniref:sensor domain-containing diguanylate cyclase n=1 Tax=Ramlibacter sp. PS4R-6 TaxID=3133438 RepID=UPI0030A37DB7